VGVWVVQFDRSKLSFGRGILYSNAWKMLTSSRSVAAQPGRLLGVGESSGFLLGSQTEFCGSPQPLCDDQSGAVARRYCRTVGCHLDSSGRQGVSTESVAVQRGRSFGTGRTFGFSVGLPGRVLPAGSPLKLCDDPSDAVARQYRCGRLPPGFVWKAGGVDRTTHILSGFSQEFLVGTVAGRPAGLPVVVPDWQTAAAAPQGKVVGVADQMST
jgi:hypothetical protein